MNRIIVDKDGNVRDFKAKAFPDSILKERAISLNAKSQKKITTKNNNHSLHESITKDKLICADLMVTTGLCLSASKQMPTVASISSTSRSPSSIALNASAKENNHSYGNNEQQAQQSNITAKSAREFIDDADRNASTINSDHINEINGNNQHSGALMSLISEEGTFLYMFISIVYFLVQK